jgi:type II secretory pathway pseudopilin PulG
MSARRQEGFTIVELLVGMIVGLIVVFAAFAILERAYTANKEASDRSDASQRGRLAMDKVVQTLRSQVCIGAQRASLTAADANSVTLLVDLSGGVRAPERRTIAYAPATRTLSESVYAGSGTFPNYTYPATPTTSRTLLTNAGPADGNPIFRYYALDVGGRGANTLLATPLSSTDLARTSRISIGFLSRPELSTSDRFGTTLQDDVFVRSADPTNPAGGLACL